MNQKPIASVHQKAFWQATILCVALLFSVLPGHAQFTGDNQTNIIDGTAVNWPTYYFVGSNYVGDAQFILDGGSLTSQGAQVGYQSGASNNLAVISGSGSIWMSTSHFYVGYEGSANRLVISDGGKLTHTSGDLVAGSSYFVPSSSNSILITGTGSVCGVTAPYGIYVGDGGTYCSLVISNGGAAVSTEGFIGGSFNGRTNIAIVTGTGSVWSNKSTLWVGYNQAGNTLIVSNGGKVFCAAGTVGDHSNGRFNSALVTGADSLWKSSGNLVIGNVANGGSSDSRLTIADGGLVVASNASVGVFASNCLIHVSGGHLAVTNSSATGLLDVRFGSLRLDSGTVTADLLRLIRSPSSVLEFSEGTIHSKGTVVSNTQVCVIGDGVGSANFHLLGGVHSFNNGLRIRTNSFLTGCGTINGTVVLDAGGAVHANCTNLVFNSAVANHGTMVVDGAVLEAFDTFVNNGKLFLLHGGTTNFHSTFINNGQILNGDIHLAIERDGSGGLFIRFTGTPDVTYRLQRAASVTGTWSDLATNTAPASGLIEYHETSPPPGQAFYRTVQP